MLPSSLSKIYLDGKTFHVKRDDLVDTFLAGNKFRKLYTLLQTPNSKYNKIISYGGTQSNAMLAIAAMCKKKEWIFEYYTKRISQRVKEQNFGNLYLANTLGMEHIELEEDLYRDYVSSLNFNLNEKTFLLDQGGADSLAQKGIAILAQEIRDANLDIKAVATPSGTGTTALFLALSLPEYKVYTVALIGDSEYLKQQMQALHKIPDNLVILEVSKKYHFAKPYKEYFEIYKKLLDAGIEFDLLYAPLMWKTLLEEGLENILYIHSGGVSGNESMLERYKTKGLDL
ncbi:MAG: 1-aminocyclopropane-1-carboxylate deaminase [Sulfurimonas sp.]|nr:1-aminocyclopropane-1-carboxylate deaminase [Sulfurimonas sp.]MDQ7059668.1 1-aminocyclopropane-1-carboxylate deaminase [Sulfurimonas sp.]